ncbi:MAG: molybdopterin molybdotransferase MoeA, partial [Endomicrobia bacterium]|nr:molybdopterin molybdotransferase MoeA [Endomicrobiia bacterium]
MKQNISFDESKNIILNSAKTPIGEEIISVKKSLNRVIAEDIISKYDIPNYHNSAMDGYAIRAVDTKTATEDKPVMLKIVGKIQAGKNIKFKISHGECFLVTTGSLLPYNSDAVIEKESVVVVDNKFIKVFSPVEKYRNIRFRGEDVKKGELVVNRGFVVSPQILGMIISCGYSKIKVYRKPLVGVISTGDELVDVGGRISTGKVYNVNTYTLSGLMVKYGCDYINFGIARDKYHQIKTKIQKALNVCDVVLVSGGVSKGDYDIVKPVL